MSTALATQQEMAGLVEQVVINGDLSKLSPKDRLAYYNAVCQSVKLNPLTRPFDYLNLSGRLVLYAKREAAEQLRESHDISIQKLERETVEGIYVVTAYAKNEKGRTDSAIGAVPIENLRGEAKANAMMKAETKAKRRVTLSICGLGMLDETEASATPDVEPVRVDHETGEVIEGALNEGPLDPELERRLVLAQCTAVGQKLGLDADARAKIAAQFGVVGRTASLDAVNALLEHLRGMEKAKENSK